MALLFDERSARGRSQLEETLLMILFQKFRNSFASANDADAVLDHAHLVLRSLIEKLMHHVPAFHHIFGTGLTYKKDGVGTAIYPPMELNDETCENMQIALKGMDCSDGEGDEVAIRGTCTSAPMCLIFAIDREMSWINLQLTLYASKRQFELTSIFTVAGEADEEVLYLRNPSMNEGDPCWYQRKLSDQEATLVYTGENILTGLCWHNKRRRSILVYTDLDIVPMLELQWNKSEFPLVERTLAVRSCSL